MKPPVPLAASLAGLVIAVAAVACGGNASPSRGGSFPGSGTPSASGLPGASTTPGDVPASAAPSLLPSGLVLPHEDPDLEARLPDSVDGVPMRKLSVGPISSAGNVGAEATRALADEIGDGSGNFSLAYADTAAGGFNVFALRIPGASTDELVERYTALTVADRPGAETDQLTLAGKTVVHVSAPGNPIGDDWFYAVGDTLFGVQAGSEADAEKLLALLP